MQMDMKTRIKKKRGVEAGVQVLERKGAEAGTERRERKGAEAGKENAAVAKNAIAAVHEARSALADTKDAKAPSASVPKAAVP